MSKKKTEQEDGFKIPLGCEVDISGVNFTVSLKSNRGETLKQITLLGLNVYEHLVNISNGNDPGVQ